MPQLEPPQQGTTFILPDGSTIYVSVEENALYVNAPGGTLAIEWRAQNALRVTRPTINRKRGPTMIVNVRCTKCQHQANLNRVSTDEIERIVADGYGIPGPGAPDSCFCRCHTTNRSPAESKALFPRLHVSIRKAR
jgi:hypothetical protein